MMAADGLEPDGDRPMATWKLVGGMILAAAACGACAPAPADPAGAPEFALQPANPFETEFAREDGVRPIAWGGWIRTLTAGTGGLSGPNSLTLRLVPAS